MTTGPSAGADIVGAREAGVCGHGSVNVWLTRPE